MTHRASLCFLPQLCTGCLRCVTTCATFHTGATSLSRARLRITRHEGHALTDIDEEDDLVFGLEVCRNCARPACRDACAPGAIAKDAETGLVRVERERCVECGACEAACPFGAIVRDRRTGQYVKCELCSGDPQCVKFCPTGALRFAAGEALPAAPEAGRA